MFKKILNISPAVLLSTTILLFILRMVVPYINFVFIPYLLFYLLFISFHIYKHFKEINYQAFIVSNTFLLLISILFIWAFMNSSVFIFPIFKELLSLIIVLLICFSFFVFILNQESFEDFNKVLCKQLILISSLVSVLGLLKFYLELAYSVPSFMSYFIKINGTSLNSDYNFYILFSFLGIASVIYGFKYFVNNGFFTDKRISPILLLILSINILFSYSRRGFILLLVIGFLLLIFLLYTHKNKDDFYIVLRRWFSSFLIVSLLLGTILFLPVSMKRNIFDLIGISVDKYIYTSSTLLYRYSTIFINQEYDYFLKSVWKEKPDPFRPDYGWGSKSNNFSFPLTGENVDIVPKKSVGYKMDSTCKASTWSNNAYSYTDISLLYQGDSVILKDELYYASVCCFVSEDFNGTWARISAEGGASGKIIHEYDLNEKGKWQKLQIYFNSTSKIPPVYLYWSRFGYTDFSGLTGYIIFAYPEYHVIKHDPKNPNTGWGSTAGTIVYPLTGNNVDIVPEETKGLRMDSTCKASTWSNNAYSYTDISLLFGSDTSYLRNKILNASVYCFVSRDFNGTWARISAEGEASGKVIQEYNLVNKGTWQKLAITFTAEKTVPPVYLYWAKYGKTDFRNLEGYVIFAYPEYFTRE